MGRRGCCHARIDTASSALRHGSCRRAAYAHVTTLRPTLVRGGISCTRELCVFPCGGVRGAHWPPFSAP
eukprot:scaffold2556_cov425-Prasinococcus_capsulatus_cf.AAC.9